MLTEEEKELAKSATWSERHTWGNGKEWCVVAMVAQHRGANFIQGKECWTTADQRSLEIAIQAGNDVGEWLGCNLELFEIWHIEKDKIFQRATY